MDNCRYYLTEQPTSVVSCNPYPFGKFVTRCLVEFSTKEGSPLTVAWYTRANIGGNPQQIFNGFNSRNTVSSVESELTVRLNENMVDSFRTYFCRVSFANGTVLSDSREAYLLSKKSMSHDFKICDDGSVQSTKESKCIDPINTQPVVSTSPPATTSTELTTPQTTTDLLKTTTTDKSRATTPNQPDQLISTTIVPDPPIPTNPVQLTTTGPDSLTTTAVDEMSTTPTDLPTTTSIDPLTTSTLGGPSTIASTDQKTTSPTDPDVPITTTIGVLATTIFDLLQTVIPSENSPSPNTHKRQTTFEPSIPLPMSSDPLSSSASPQAQPSDSSPPGDVGASGGQFDDEALLFLTIGAAVFIFIMVYFIVFCLCLWSRQCRECGYNFCCANDLCGCACNCCLDDI